ncbi:trans-sulfuration enzyme family protein [Actinomadura rubrisoli]|uniref:Cystathionine gamma-synthase n=1 Tax=Actinomadura rubrisoli TaxID=2530368 RepID=A0A4R5AKZ0_9ACTN|nr:PLP-dependent transferase [Actinomadura rubrisoli]TDD73598.1 cystathionine gamma-synthase [Actinomadura rubrisoli]
MRRDLRELGENSRAVHLPPLQRAEAESASGFAAGLASLEGFRLSEPVEGEAFASGRAAVAAVLLAFAGAGAHVIAPATAHGGVHDLLARLGVETSFVPAGDPDAVRAALRPSTRLVWAETLADPALAVADLPSLAEIAHDAGALLAVDSTLTTPVVCRPLEHGADLVVHSSAAYLGGHGDASGGAVAGPAGPMTEVRRALDGIGAPLAPDESSRLRRGLETLPLRVRRQCDTASVFAASIAHHPAVRSVGYPGLPEHPGHGLARVLFDAGPEGTRFGAVVTVVPHGGADAGLALARAVRLAAPAASLGGTRTTAAHAASTTHRRLDEAGLRSAGIDPGAVRFSLGLEDADDLVRDVSDALDTLGPAVPSPSPPASLVADPG